MRAWIALACLSLLAACGPGPDENSGGDESRATAVAIPFGEVISDRVSRDDGDATDWKRFRLGHAARVNVEIYWDRPEVDARFELRDQFGVLLGKKSREQDSPSDILSADLQPGDYFLAVRSEGAGSVYSLVLSTGEAVGLPGAPAEMLRPGEEPRPE